MIVLRIDLADQVGGNRVLVGQHFAQGLSAHGAIGGQRIVQHAVFESRDAGACQFGRRVGLHVEDNRLVQRLGEIRITPGFHTPVGQAGAGEFFTALIEQ